MLGVSAEVETEVLCSRSLLRAGRAAAAARIPWAAAAGRRHSRVRRPMMTRARLSSTATSATMMMCFRGALGKAAEDGCVTARGRRRPRQSTPCPVCSLILGRQHYQLHLKPVLATFLQSANMLPRGRTVSPGTLRRRDLVRLALWKCQLMANTLLSDYNANVDMLRCRFHVMPVLLGSRLAASILLQVCNSNLDRRHHGFGLKAFRVVARDPDKAYSLARPRGRVMPMRLAEGACIPCRAGSLILDRLHCAVRVMDGCSVGRP